MEFVKQLKCINDRLCKIIAGADDVQYEILAIDIKKNIIRNTNTLRKTITKLPSPVKRAKLLDLVDTQTDILCNKVPLIPSSALMQPLLFDAFCDLKDELPHLVHMCDDMRYLLYSCHCSHPDCIKTYLHNQALARGRSPPKCELRHEPNHICTSSCIATMKETRAGY